MKAHNEVKSLTKFNMEASRSELCFFIYKSESSLQKGEKGEVGARKVEQRLTASLVCLRFTRIKNETNKANLSWVLNTCAILCEVKD